MAKPQTEQPADALVPVKIKTENHVHAGQLVEKGATINVPPETAAWLRDNNIGE